MPNQTEDWFTEKAGSANGPAQLGADGKIAADDLPDISITNTYEAANETAQLALSIQQGDVCVRSDENKTYINKNGDNDDMGDWQLLPTPPDAVLSVNSNTGAVTLNASDVGASESGHDHSGTYEPVIGAKGSAFNKNFGSGAGQVCQGNDSRLSDDRDPTSHSNSAHSETYITTTSVTYETLNNNSDVGTGAAQVAAGDHTHAQLHAESHTVASHSDTTATGTELDELTDGSETTLHSHAGGGAPEGTAVLSTGETGGTKFLREDGDDSCSWQAVPTPTVAHSATTGQTVNDHHNKSHAHTSADGSGAISTDQIFKAGDGGTTDYLSIATDGQVTLFGAARQYRKVEFVPYNIGGLAGTYNSISCGAAGLGSLNGFYFKTFDDGQSIGTAEAANIAIELGSNYVAGTDITLRFPMVVGTTSTNDVRWQAGRAKVSEGEDFSAATYTWATPQNVAGPGTAWERKLVTFTLDGTGLAAGDCISIVVFRDADNAADDYVGDAYFAGLCAKFLKNGFGDD